MKLADFFLADTGRALRKTGFAGGDFDYSGGVANADDYMLIDRALLNQLGTLAGAPAPLPDSSATGPFASPAALPAMPTSPPGELFDPVLEESWPDSFDFGSHGDDLPNES